MNDWQLLQEYADSKSEEAFSAIVNRYVGGVHAAARRQVQDPVLAQDVTQAVFIILAKKAGRISSGTPISGWLLKTTYFVATRALRSERRRQWHEQEAAQMQLPDSSTPAPHQWNQLAPCLDQGLMALSEIERNAVVLRFFEEKSFKEVGQTLGLTEEAARKRVGRALERLRALFARRGAVISAAGLAQFLSSQSPRAVPPDLVESIEAQAKAVAPPVSAGLETLVNESLRSMAWVKASAILNWSGGALLAGLVGLGIFLWQAPREPSEQAADFTAAPVAAERLSTELAGRPENGIAAETPAERHMLLRLVDAETGMALTGGRVLARGLHLPIDGAGTCPVPIPEGPVENLTLWVQVHGYEMISIDWRNMAPDAFPDEYTVKLAPAATIAGVVQDESGQPVANATLVVATLGGMDIAKKENVSYHRDLAFAITGEDGRWSFDYVTRKEDGSRLIVTHPEFAYTAETVPVTGPSATNAVITLSRGVAVKGVVLTENGEPLPGASIREIHNFSRRRLSGTSGEEGRFIFPHVSPGKLQLAVEAPGYSVMNRTFEVSGDMEEIRFELTRGRLLQGLVMDEESVPIAGARIQADQAGPWGDSTLRWSTRTDRLGRFIWESAPDYPVPYRIFANGYAHGRATLLADGQQHVVRLEKLEMLRVTGTVRDAGTGLPLETFTVLLRERGDNNYLAEGREGAFAAQFPRHDYFTSYQIQIEAEGYTPALSESMRTDAGDQELEFALERSGGFAGLVLLPGGEPAAGAHVALCGQGFGGTMQRPGRFLSHIYDQDYFTHTDAEGRFALKPALNAAAVRVIHEFGCASAPLEGLAERPIILEPWGRVEGVVLIGGQPGAGLRVVIQNTRGLERHEFISFSYRTETDPAGRFVFDQVPPGRHLVYRAFRLHESLSSRAGFSHETEIEVPPGRTASVVVGGRGRIVRGRMLAPAADIPIDWTIDLQRLVLNQPDVPAPNRRDFPDDLAFRQALSDWDGARPKYFLMFQPDGSFQADDVPPGTYELRIRVTRPPEDPLDRNRFLGEGDVIGALSRQIVVAEEPNGAGDRTLDLGLLELEMK